MANIFSRTNDSVAKVPRNVFDGSFQNNLTLDIGGLYPVFCKEVIPGDSFKITPTFGLRFQPLVFPIQTRMQANLHFFYVRNRNLWKDWARFITNADGALTDSSKESPIPPYIGGTMSESRYQSMFTTGSLGDYLGLPTTIYGAYGRYKHYAVDSVTSFQSAPAETTPPITNAYALQFMAQHIGQNFSVLRSSLGSNRGSILVQTIPYSNVPYHNENVAEPESITLRLSVSNPRDFDSIFNGVIVLFTDAKDNLIFAEPLYELDAPSAVGNEVTITYSGDIENVHRVAIAIPPTGTDNGYADYPLWNSSDGLSQINLLSVSFLQRDTAGIDNIAKEDNPFLDGSQKISALPFRAYESIYNSFYRDIRNNPYIINGKPEYNKYIPTDAGGVDSTTYSLRYRNWEPDFLTTSVQSPQQGIAPLVGVSSTGTMKFADEEGHVYTAQAQFAPDGETITGFSVNSPDMPVGNLRALVDIASSGISINDFRNVNALQRYLETNMRKGLRYKDWIKGHYDVDTSYAELDMPEFLGGVSKPVIVNQITSTASTEMDSLGDYAGQASCMGSGNTISRFFDEHGFVIGILSISPVPNYSQLLPKFWLKANPLDYYTPEFGHIGYQPITYSEVCPLQSASASEPLTDVFGYQRAWYDYIANVDEVHGEFRTTLQDYLINRYFDSRPELGEQFLLISPKDTNRPFVVSDRNNQPILGQIYFDLKMKRPIPQLGIPRLE